MLFNINLLTAKVRSSKFGLLSSWFGVCTTLTDDHMIDAITVACIPELPGCA